MTGSKAFMKALPDHQRAVFFPLRLERDVPIARLYGLLYNDDCEPRRKQQIVGAIVTRLNRKLEAQGLRYKIIPGFRRRTYRLQSTR